MLIDPKINLHFRRFEFKYPILRSIADRIIPEILNYMVWDEYAKNDDGYDVYSLYMDSLDMKAYFEKLDGLMYRKKLRIRTYSKNYDKDNLFFEIKRKNGIVILKDRILVEAKDVNLFIQNPFLILNNVNYNKNFLNEFLWQFSKLQMSPKLLVHYKRKAFFGKSDPQFRVTFDYDLGFVKTNELNFNIEYDRSYCEMVIMEVKFNGAMPKWFHEVIEMYKLTQETFSKYCHGIDTVIGLPNFF
jgi:SPX domain protein involved in polyphosphate accumulation